MKDSAKATDKQQRVLDYVKKQIKEEGYAPSVREICKALDLKSTSTVHGYLARLKKKGLIEKVDMKSRTIRLVDEDGKSEYSFILTGYATNYSYLFGISEQLKAKYKTSAIVDGIVIKYDNTMTVDNGTEDLKQVQITLKIKEWSV